MLENTHSYLAKDFLETAEGLCFAVVQSGTERCDGQAKVLCFLRYILQADNGKKQWRKVGTQDANSFLSTQYPHYLYHSAALDTAIHAVDVVRIRHHHQPRRRLQEILSHLPQDRVEQDLTELCVLLQKNGLDLTKTGVTGSLLIGAQQMQSDIDLVIYDRENFHKARKITQELIENGQLGALADSDWQEAFARRSCTLSLPEYVWHEQRKLNKGLINNRKFDLNFVTEQISKTVTYRKLGAITLQCTITGDWYGFDYPAVYAIDHTEIKSVACFIATYTGQAFTGETVEISGLLEQSEQGEKRIVVGSSREAPGEYIKVVRK
ncbi:MAG: hypothetical protein FJ190_07330 [Gammaproteobacteria bacterium]|nr:hypothetical protein [Gammaproteobacteria bacterium]